MHFQQILISHVNNVRLGRRNFHYILSSLILDHQWSSDIAEYGAINVTGLRMVDFKSKVARQFFRNWDNLQRDSEDNGKRDVSTVGILAHDAVHVLEEAFLDLMQKRPSLFMKKRVKGLATCDVTADDRLRVWEHGHTIVKALQVSLFARY